MADLRLQTTPVERGERRCQTCGKVHDAYLRDPKRPTAGISWAATTDGHPYHQESWRDTASRYGWSPDAERDRYVGGGMRTTLPDPYGDLTACNPVPRPEPSVGGMGRPKRNRPTKASPERIAEIRAKKCQECRLCDNPALPGMPINAAHLIPKGMGGTIGGVWTESNIVGLCGHGNIDGCHALVEKRDRAACHLLRARLTDAEYAYVVSKMGEQWLDNRFPVMWEGAA